MTDVLSVEESARGVSEARRLLQLNPEQRTEALYGRTTGDEEESVDQPCGTAAACMLLARTVLDKADHAPTVAAWPVRVAVREVLEVAQLPKHQQERDMAERDGRDGRNKG